MPDRAAPTVFKPSTLSDAVDSTNGPPGAMQLLQNLVPAPFNHNIMVARPAAVQLTAFPGFSGAAAIELQFIVGSRIYGMVQSSRFPGKSEPFIFDYRTSTFVTVSNVTAANTPNQTANVGDWVPPTATQVGGVVIVTHPGFTGGGGPVMGWFDMSGLTSNTITGASHSNTVVTGLSFNPIQAGWTVGMMISSSAGDIPAGTVITAMTSNTVTLSQAATATNATITLTVTGGTFAAPLWTGGNLNTNPLPAPPVLVASFNGRAYYGVGPTLQFSDVGQPLQDSNNPNVQVINFQNGLNVTVASGTPFTNVTGGVFNALLVFQGVSFIWQITGDAATNNLAVNLLASGEGTLAPNAVAFIPNIGTSFVSPDGVQFVTLQGTVTPAVGTQGDGVALPFINALNPSRMCSAWNNDTLRVAVLNAVSGSSIFQEYWLHTKLNVWTGPHSFPATLITESQIGGGFIISSTAQVPGLWGSMSLPTRSSNYIELGSVLQCTASTCLLPDNQAMTMNALMQTMIGFGSTTGMTVTVTVQRENLDVLDQVSLPVNHSPSGATWDAFNWDQANWGHAQTEFVQHWVPWSEPLIFKQMFLTVQFLAAAGNMMGNIYMRIEVLGYPILGQADADYSGIFGGFGSQAPQLPTQPQGGTIWDNDQTIWDPGL